MKPIIINNYLYFAVIFRSLLLSLVMVSAYSVAHTSEDIEFEATFLRSVSPEKLDLKRFSQGAAMLPGTYLSEIWLNGEYLTRDSVTFKGLPNYQVSLCVQADVLKQLPLELKLLAKDITSAVTQGQDCISLAEWLPEATVNYDSSYQQLNISLPQIYVKKQARDAVDPILWDKGISAATLGYNFSAYRSESGGDHHDSAYGSLNTGLNLGAWYFRHNGNLNWQQESQKKYHALNTYVQRDIPALQGRVLIGESYTSGQLFDTLPFTGVSLTSVSHMLPPSQQGYAPEIRGIARTNARVTVHQGEQIIYETTVPPGDFIINDLYPTGYGGNLAVTVHEANGSKQHFEVPYAAVAQLLRPGSSQYSFTVGKYRSHELKEPPLFAETTWQQGLTNRITGNVGLQYLRNYYAGQFGIAVDTSIGALSTAITHTHLNTGDGKSLRGQSYNLSYSHYVRETGSNFSLATYRFSTKDYRSLSDAISSQSITYDYGSTPRNRVTLSLNQSLPEHWGQFYLSGSMENSWERKGYSQQYQLGYNNHWQGISYGVSMTRSQNSRGKFQNSWLFNVSLPLESKAFRHTPSFSTQLTHDGQGKWRKQLNLSGTIGEQAQFHYNLNASQHQGSDYATSLSGNYRNSWSALSASYSKGKNYSSASAGINGTVIAHSGGVSFSSHGGDTFALVEAKGAEGAKVSSYSNIHIDSQGYAIVPNLNPYQMNDIIIDPKGASDGVELRTTRQRVAPLSGAVVKVNYSVKQGAVILLRLRQSNQQPIPFGSEVTDEKGGQVGHIGQAGQLFARVQTSTGELKVQWGSHNQMQCRVKYQLPDSKSSWWDNTQSVQLCDNGPR
ncbi:fimbrial biogenesis outer membrane usher protein [Xenorhabdus sp. ZM]|uniref:fimbria/pilus outer membrane usher protein n=1 Tax=Xenorhabdus szentirmaii TaxID=290112 RepID=UPI0019B3423B|nr:fimbria/pilus outer membrane usher protein [Xenorhabdus sp. ZM]MBD2803271.1 fimbrial biogenesis outer membrane usher protein [Xenorhabdus sp. ZM]